MNHEQLVLVGDKGRSIPRQTLRMMGINAPSFVVKDEVIEIIGRSDLVDQVQFPTENGYRAAGIAIERLSSYLNLFVIIPSVAPRVEGTVIQRVVFSSSTVKAVQCIFEFN
jgi:hypothetical protein